MMKKWKRFYLYLDRTAKALTDDLASFAEIAEPAEPLGLLRGHLTEARRQVALASSVARKIARLKKN